MDHKHYLSGVTTLLILKLLENEELYGYQIIQRLEQQSDHVFQYQTGSLYPVLYRMEKDGLIRHTEKTGDGQKRRVYYSITDEGKKRLFEETEEWSRFAKGVQSVLWGKPALSPIVAL